MESSKHSCYLCGSKFNFMNGCWIMGRLSITKGMRGNMSAKTAQQSSSTRWTRININVSQLMGSWTPCTWISLTYF
ncbi:hypothetical protein ACE6H2_014908 [Prunus campanulata]